MSNAEDNTIDIVTQTSYRITDELNAIDAAVAAAIAAAVQAEREACANLLEELAGDGERAIAIMTELGYETHESYLAEAMRFGADAIRARNGNTCKCGINKATEPHPCPYQSDVNNDETYLCTCCNDCAYECAQDI